MINAKEIKVVCFDVDGVLTDGVYTVSDKGDISKNFYTRDFYGIELLLKNGYKVVIVTSSVDDVIEKRILKIRENSLVWSSSCLTRDLVILRGVKSKLEMISYYLDEVLWSWHNVAYMGDGNNDLECMKMSLISACPADAEQEIMNESSYLSDYNGGRGAVYDFCRYLIKERDK